MDPKIPIRSLDYTVVRVRQMDRMRDFYENVLGFPLHRELSRGWIEFRVGSNILALADYGSKITDPVLPVGALSLQLAFRVAPDEVATCAATLRLRDVEIIDLAPVSCSS